MVMQWWQIHQPKQITTTTTAIGEKNKRAKTSVANKERKKKKITACKIETNTYRPAPAYPSIPVS